MTLRLVDRLRVFLTGQGADSALVGRRGESVAARVLRDLGFRLLDRNVLLSRGEIDLVCESPDREWIVLVEVKARHRQGSHEHTFLPPELAVDRTKRHKLIALAAELRRRHPRLRRPARLDVVGVELMSPGGWRERYVLRHYEGVVTLDTPSGDQDPAATA